MKLPLTIRTRNSTLTGTNQKIVYKPLPENDPLKRRPDISLALKELNWKPSLRKIGLRKTYDYFCTLIEKSCLKKIISFEKFNKL